MNDINSSANYSNSNGSLLNHETLVLGEDQHVVSSKSSSAASATPVSTSPTQNTKMYILTPSQANTNSVLNLKQILQLFNCAISQEQAWAVLYQTLNALKFLFKSSLVLVKANADSLDINMLYFNKDGNVMFGFKNAPDSANYSEFILGI